MPIIPLTLMIIFRHPGVIPTRKPWKIYKKHAFLSGQFIWTGFDYIGEPWPYQWPSRSSYFGIVDLAGFPKDVYYMYQGEWTNKTVLHLLPHWNWEAGKVVDVGPITVMPMRLNCF
jgi:hypothetical protein